MSAGAGYIPAAVPPCAYAPRMTRAAAQALAAAGGLSENCVVVITNGPTIGTAGNTSPTEIELNPVSPTQFGQAARVHTTYTAEAWTGQYSISGNTITRLQDDKANVVEDASGSIIATQFPWGYANVRSNNIKATVTTTVSLGNWTIPAVAGAIIEANTITGGNVATIVSLTGLNASTHQFIGNTIVDGGSLFANAAWGAGSQFNFNNIRSGFSINLTPPSLAPVILFNSNECYDHNTANASFDYNFAGFSAHTVVGNKFRANGTATRYAMTPDGPATLRGNFFDDAQVSNTMSGVTNALTMTNNVVAGGTLTFTSSAAVTLTGCTLTDVAGFTKGGSSPLTYTDTTVIAGNTSWQGATGAIAVTRCTFIGATIGRTNHVGTVTLSGTTWEGSTLSLVPGTAANSPISITDCEIVGSTVTNTSAGTSTTLTRVQMQGSQVVSAAAPTRSITVVDSRIVAGVVTQARTAAAGTDTINRLDMVGGTFTLSSNAGATGAVTFNDVTMRGSSAYAWANGTTLAAAAGLFLDGGAGYATNGATTNCRITCGAVVTGGANDHSGTIIDLAGTYVLNLANVNRLANKSFNDLV